MTTTFEKRKLSSMILLAQLEDEEIFDLIEQLLLSKEGKDWGEGLSTADKTEIEEGIDDMLNKKVEDYDNFQNRMKTLFK